MAVLALVLAAGPGTAGCDSSVGSSPPPAPVTSPTASAPPTARAESNGLTVRYRDEAGDLQTLHVEDFPR